MAKREMTAEQKKANAERLAKAREAKKLKEEAIKLQEEVIKAEEDNEIEILKEQIRMLKEQLATSRPQVIQVEQTSEKVHFLFMAEVSDENIYNIGENGIYGKIVGKTGSFYVPKNDLPRVMDASFRQLLEMRWIIAVSGLTEDERIAYKVNYHEGEILDEKAFARIIEMGDEILTIYPDLCDSHKEMVAKRYYEAFVAHNPIVTRERVLQLHKLSTGDGAKNSKAAFATIIEEMTAAEIGK